MDELIETEGSPGRVESCPLEDAELSRHSACGLPRFGFDGWHIDPTIDRIRIDPTQAASLAESTAALMLEGKGPSSELVELVAVGVTDVLGNRAQQTLSSFRHGSDFGTVG